MTSIKDKPYSAEWRHTAPQEGTWSVRQWRGYRLHDICYTPTEYRARQIAKLLNDEHIAKQKAKK